MLATSSTPLTQSEREGWRQPVRADWSGDHDELA